jgi:histidine phosphotransferase ChpT
MTAPPTIGALDLAALLCSRLCHDLISPVGAIINGLEVMEEDKNEETKTFGAQIELGDAEKAARGLLEDGKATLVWNLPRALVAKNRVKLLLNMLLVASGAIPRGGTLTADPMGEGYRVTARGLNARLAPATADLLAGTPAEPVNAHAIQPFYTGILARDCSFGISARLENDAVVVTAV